MKKISFLLFLMLLYSLSLFTSCNDKDLIDGNCNVPFMEKLSGSLPGEGGHMVFSAKKDESFFHINYLTTIQGTDTVRYPIDVTNHDIGTPQNISEDWFSITTESDEENTYLSLVNVELAPNNDKEERALVITVYGWDCSNTLTITQAPN